MPKRTQLAMLLTDAAPGQAMPISLRTQVDSPPPVASPKEPVAEQVEDAGLPPGVLGEIAPAPVKTPPPAEVQPVESSPTIMSPILPYVAWQPMGGSVFSESIVPELTPAPSSSVAAVTPEPKPSPAMQAAKDLPPETDIARVQSRVRDAVSDELYENFDKIGSAHV